MMQRRLVLARPPDGVVYKTINPVGFVSASTGSGAASTGQTLNMVTGAGASTGYFAIAWAAFLIGTGTLTMNRSGWTAMTAINISTTLSSRVFYKVLDATDISNATISITSSSGINAMAVAVFQNVDPVSPVSATNTTSEATNDTTKPIASIAPAIFPAYVYAVQAMSVANTGTLGLTWPGGWTEQVDRVTSQASGRQAQLGSAYLTANPLLSGSVATADIVPSAAAHNGATTFALKPAVGP